MKIEIYSQSNGMSNTSYHKRFRSEGQRRWWLRHATGEFVAVPSQRGDREFRAEIDLTPGQYTLGTGPIKHGVRETITVTDDGTLYHQ